MKGLSVALLLSMAACFEIDPETGTCPVGAEGCLCTVGDGCDPGLVCGPSQRCITQAATGTGEGADSMAGSDDDGPADTGEGETGFPGSACPADLGLLGALTCYCGFVFSCDGGGSPQTPEECGSGFANMLGADTPECHEATLDFVECITDTTCQENVDAQPYFDTCYEVDPTFENYPWAPCFPLGAMANQLCGGLTWACLPTG